MEMEKPELASKRIERELWTKFSKLSINNNKPTYMIDAAATKFWIKYFDSQVLEVLNNKWPKM